MSRPTASAHLGASVWAAGLPVMGAWVFVCGPSGAGKDSVIAWARERLAADSRVVFARRLVTRPAQVGSDHETVTPGDFDALLHREQLAWHWRSHGFGYGIARRYARQVAWGRVVVVNGSREHLAGMDPMPGVYRVAVEASADRLATRLLQRGRDDLESIERRLARNSRFAELEADLVIGNDGELCQAGARLQHYLQGLATRSLDPPGPPGTICHMRCCMPPDIQIREAVVADAPALFRLLEQLGYPETQAFIGKRLAQQQSHPDALLLVAQRHGQVLGFISLHFIPQLALAGDFCRVSYFCVSEGARSLGIGAALEQRAQAEALARGCDRIEVHSNARRESAHRFYRRQGYAESPKYLVKRLASGRG